MLGTSLPESQMKRLLQNFLAKIHIASLNSQYSSTSPDRACTKCQQNEDFVEAVKCDVCIETRAVAYNLAEVHHIEGL